MSRHANGLALLKKHLTQKNQSVGDGGKVAKVDDKIIAAHERTIQEPLIRVTESISVKVRRWYENPNGSEVLQDDRRGYYTDE
jgi:hypothetical protein